MTSKEQLLVDVKEAVARGMVSKSELLTAGGFDETEIVPEKKEHHFDIAKILYGIGGLIVLAGLVFLIQRMWNSFGAAAQILVTLGSAMALYISAVLLYQLEKLRLVATVLFGVAGALMPLGIYVTLYHLSPGGNVWLGQLIMALIPAAVYLASYRLFRHQLLLFIGVILATWSIYALVGLMLDGVSYSGDTLAEFWAYLTLIVGIAHALLGYWSKDQGSKYLRSAFYLLGSGAMLGGGFALSFMQDFWNLLYFVLILAVIYLSTALRSGAFLVLGSIGLIAHLIHISFEYFAESYGWPLALILSGFLIMGVGYATVMLHQRFMGQAKTP